MAGKAKTHSEFIKEFEEKQPELFEKLEILEEYVKASDHILVRDKYGECRVTPACLLAGYYPTTDSAVNPHEYFLNNLKDKHLKIFEQLEFISDFQTSYNYILVKDKYGICKTTPRNLLAGHLPGIQSAINKNKYFENQLKTLQPELFGKIKIMGEFKSSRETVLVKDEYGLCESTPNILYGGSFPSIRTAVNPNEYFTNQSKKVHGDLYDYSLVNYVNGQTKVEIISEYGSFWQTPHSHLKKHGCPKLAASKKQESSIGWTYTKWEKAGLKSKNFDSFKVYVIQCQNENKELFYKIGKTYSTLKQRFYNKKSMPYNYLEIKIFTGSAKEMSELENKLHKKHKHFKYLPKKKFDGMYECYSQIDFLTI